MGLSFAHIEVLLLIAAMVALVARRIGLPYTVGLVATGIALSFLNLFSDVELTKELIFSALLPPLIFEAAIQMEWRELRRNLDVTLILATLGVVLSAGLVSAGLHIILGWGWLSAIIVGVLLSATDPVSVIATFKAVSYTHLTLPTT